MRFVTSVPSAAITYTSLLPSRFVLNAICVPSGDHAMSVSVAGLFVSRVTFEPSTFIV